MKDENCTCEQAIKDGWDLCIYCCEKSKQAAIENGSFFIDNPQHIK
jgi:hypothetical protein